MVKLLTIGPEGINISDKQVYGGVKRIYISINKLLEDEKDIELDILNISNIKKNPFNVFLLVQKISKAEIVHIHCSFHTFIHSYQLLIPLSISKIFRKKLIVTYHTGYDKDFIFRGAFFLKVLFKFCDKVIVPSYHSKNYLVENQIVSNNKVEVIPNFIDEEFLEKWMDISTNIDRGIDIITISGKLNRETYYTKGIDYVLDISRNLPSLKFVIVGKISNEKIRHLIEKNSIGNIYLPGYMDKNKMIDTLRKSRIYLQLSRRESFGIAVVEAMSQGTVPIVFDVGALPEIVGSEGYVVNYNDKKEIVRNINNIIRGTKDFDPRKRVLLNYTSECYIEKYMNVVKEVRDM